ncbi:uncharacterized protein LOC123262441 isoform X1 [Cotesia glomerata]|uniref:uncharacterized protein LOC123262441 isoform X1 n=1 Tax=Cotesia glomerata TaxID=32391 RepID=UPI001D02A702|nr:uncharacterized protein LOC123262441 isoform X1 [Cotesia glomerata]
MHRRRPRCFVLLSINLMIYFQMSKQKESKFHVIELFQPPYIDPEKYVCVPNSWMRLRETTDGPALVKFPVEELSKIKKRVKKQEFSENWTVFLANIKYSTNSYKDARNYIKILNKISDQEQSSTKIVEDVTPTSNKKVLEYQSSSETNKFCTTSTQNSDAEPVSKEISKQLDLTNAEVRIGRTESEVGTADSSLKARRYWTRQLLKISLSGNNTVSLPDQSTKENLPKTSHCVEESSKTNNNQENELSAKNSSELIRKWQIVTALRSVFGDNFKEILEQLHSDYEKNHLMLEKMRLAFIENCNIIKGLIQLTNEVSNGPDISDLDSTFKELKNSMMALNINENDSDKETRSTVQNDTRKKEEKKHNSDGTEVKNNNPLYKIRCQTRKFTLPPEYDPNDSRWTLKHRKKKSGLVELLLHSRVYIDAIQLSNIKITSKDSKTLARKLLLEIFTENALSICSLTGKKANAFDLKGTSVRPGLDKHARTILLNYVKKHAAEQNWVEFDLQLISNTIRNKMQEMRSKHQNIVEK